MDRVAIISDVHGNVTALKTVLKDIKKRRVKKIICLGDSVTKCANPDKVIDLLKKNCDVVLKGNCDDTISSDRAFKSKYWSRVKIGEERADYLKNLPVMYEFYMSGQLIRLFHSSPIGLNYIFNPMYSNICTKYKDVEIKDVNELFKNTKFIGKGKKDPIPDIVGFGHLHTPNMYKYGNRTIFNTGSVGAPNEMENSGKEDSTNSFSTLASYVIIEGKLNSKEFGAISISNIRIPYDMEKEVKYLEESDMPGKEKIIHTLRTASINKEKE